MKNKNLVMDETKKVVKTGIVGMGGMAALGAMAPLAGPAAGPIVGITGAAVGLGVLGQGLHSGGKIGHSMMSQNKKSCKKKNKQQHKQHGNVMKNILG